MELGQPGELKRNAQGGFTNRFRLEEGENIIRVLYGPIRSTSVYYPTLIEDKEAGGELKQGLRVLKVPREGCPLDRLRDLDLRIRKKKGEDKPQSALKHSSKWLYLIINQGNPDEPVVELAEFPYSVFQQIVKLEEARSTKERNKLRNGLIFMYDLIITKTVEPGLPKQFGTKYTVEVDVENEYSGKIPAQYLNKTASELSDRGLKVEKFFTPEAMAAISNCSIDLEEEAKPQTAEEMNAQLTKLPIYLDAKDRNGRPMFPAQTEFENELEAMGLAYLGEGDAVAALPEADTLDDDPNSLTEEEDPPPVQPKKKSTRTKPTPLPVDDPEELEDEPEDEDATSADETDDEFPEW